MFDDCIFVLHIQFFLDNLNFQLNQENIHLILTILTAAFALDIGWNY